MKQKFRKLTSVRVKGSLSNNTECDGIINGTYSQIFGGDDIDSYSVYIVEKDKVVDCISWIEESQLTEVPNQDREKAEEMIEVFNLDT